MMTVEATTWPSPRIVYSSRYNIGFFGFERLHPFDGRKYGRAWRALRRRFGRRLKQFHVAPGRQISAAELSAFHDASYLRGLDDPAFLARVLEIPALRRAPARLIDWRILKPMRWATMGTIIAAREAMKSGLAVNLGGGYHHASPERGHGFCVYADVGPAIHCLRRGGNLAAEDRVVHIDLDAHQGDGVCRTFHNDSNVLLYDQYNQHIFPRDALAQRRIDCDVPMDLRCTDAEYLVALKERLPPFLDAITRSGNVKLAIYNAGTDIFVNDLLGGMAMTASGVLERDRFVLRQLIAQKVPTLVLLSGGYSRESHALVTQMVAHILETWGNDQTCI